MNFNVNLGFNFGAATHKIATRKIATRKIATHKAPRYTTKYYFGTGDGAATHRAPLREPLALVPPTG